MVVPIKSSPPPKVKMDKQEFIGNCKEFRIESNKDHLRIIGNGNKIRVTDNSGHLEVIGNSTRVKIVKNNGKISYTGNNGKVYLGKDSSVTHVNYIGNNGILKLVSSAELNTKCNLCQKCKTTKSLDHRSTGKVRSNQSSKSSTESDDDDASQEKFASDFESFYENSSNDSHRSKINFKKCKKNSRFCLYVKNNISMPNLDAIGCSAQISNSIKIASSTGNIVVSNNFQM